MEQKLKDIRNIENDYSILHEELINHNILKLKLNFYTKEDKDDFLVLWKKYIRFFRLLQHLIKKYKYRTFFFKINYNNLIIRRYLLIFYFNCLVDLLDIFGEHEEFIRTFLGENVRYDYSKISKFIYKPNYVNLVNTPSVFLKINKNKIDKRFYFMLEKEKNNIGKEKRILTDYKNIYFYIKKEYLKILFFISKITGNIIAKTRLSTRSKGFISKKNINKYLKIAKPGDIFLSRGNWNFSNMTIPGFWKHMSLYLGNGKFIKSYFINKYNFLNNLDDELHYIIEVNADGVRILEINDFCSHNDYLGISRTNFKKEKILRVLDNSLEYFGKEYDYVFNFYSNKNVICSELVIKSYAKEFNTDEGLDFTLNKMGITLIYYPNNFIKEIFKKNNNLTAIMFIDSLEKTSENFISTNEEFEKSFGRSRFSFMLD